MSNKTNSSSNATTTASSLIFESSRLNKKQNVTKPKRQLDDFDFDSSSFDDPTLFHAQKISTLTDTLDDDLDDDRSVGAFIPNTSGIKIRRSNAKSLGTHGAESANLAASSSNAAAQISSKSIDTQSTSQANQVATPYFDDFFNEPKYGTAKSSAPAKIAFNSYPTLTDFTSNPIYSSLARGPMRNVAASQGQSTVQKAPYNTHYGQSASKVYAPLHNHAQPRQHYGLDMPFDFAYSPYDTFQYTTTPAVEGKNLAVLQLQSAHTYPSYAQSVESGPVLLSAESGTNYKTQTQPGFGVSFDFPNPKNENQRLGTNSPFLKPSSLGTIQVVPLASATSTAQFPKFSGASLSPVLPSRGFSKIPNDYEEFKSQPLLHFDGHVNLNKPKAVKSTSRFNGKQLEQIRADVENIDKRKPSPPSSKGDDEDESVDDSGEGEYAKLTFIISCLHQECVSI